MNQLHAKRYTKQERQRLYTLPDGRIINMHPSRKMRHYRISPAYIYWFVYWRDACYPKSYVIPKFAQHHQHSKQVANALTSAGHKAIRIAKSVYRECECGLGE